MKFLRGILVPSKKQEVSSLVQQLWVPEDRKTTLCIDSYTDGVLQGRFYGFDRKVQHFSSLSQFLILMEELLEQTNTPQSDTTRRSFSALLRPDPSDHPRGSIRPGARATFELQVLFRQHSSWQGTVRWRDQHREQSFRSVLELILLLDSALRGLTGREAS